THENWVLGTAFGIDSKRLDSVGRDRAAKLIDASAGQFLENVNQLHGELAAVARHPRADEIVIGGEDRIPYIYRMDRPHNMKVGEDASLVRQLAAQDGPIFALDWSPDGTRIAVAGAGPSVNIYDAGTGSPLASCAGHAAGIYAVAFSPDSAHLATGGFDGQVRLYRAKDCTLEKSFVPVPLEGRSARFLVEPTADAPVGVYPIRVVTGDGISNVQLFTVGAFPELTEDESRPGALPNSNDSIDTAQPLPRPPFTLNATLRGPERDVFRLSARAGERRVIEVEAR